MNRIKATLLTAALLVGSASTLPAAVIFSVEAPGVQTTTIAGTTVETFDSLPLGPLGVYVSPVGTYSPGAQIVGADQYGGTNQTRYNAVGAQSGTTQYQLAFGGLVSYFGFYWPAMDALNSVAFYEGATQKASFRTSDITPFLSPAYFGNPNTGENAAEAYAYVNFFASDAGSRFDRVVFMNDSNASGLESDNHAVLAPVPEPSSAIMLLSGFAGVVAVLRRRQNRA